MRASYCIEHQTITTPSKATRTHMHQYGINVRAVRPRRHVCCVFARQNGAWGEITITCSYCIERQLITQSNSSTHNTRAAINTNVRAVCPGPTRHPVHTFNQRTKINARPSLTLFWCVFEKQQVKLHTASYYRIKHQERLRVRSITHASIAANVRAVRPRPAWHPFNTFHEWRSLHCRGWFNECLDSTCMMRVRLRPQ